LSPSFADLGVPAEFVSVLARRGITDPFPIQTSTLPPALAGRDVCGKAPTGSGKTLAFGIAMLARVERAAPRRPTALVLVPTRELAAQVRDELAPLAQVAGRTIGAFYGGTGYESQRRMLRKGLDIVVACPGRLEDLLSQNDLRLDDVSFVVLDEADRMADMGFLPAVKRLLDKTAEQRQTLLFSATLDGDVDVLIKRYQTNPSTHEVETDEADAGDVAHRFWTVERGDRVAVTARLVRQHGSTVVFCRTKHGADRLAKQLGNAGVGAVAIHGNRSQGQRERALADFSNGRALALVATDVAARGIHVDDVGCVVHFDPPPDPKDYVHRSGRTGRAGADGVVVTLVTPDVQKIVRTMLRGTDLDWSFEAPVFDADSDVRYVPPSQSAPTRTDRDDRPERSDRNRTHAGARPPRSRNGRSNGERPTSGATSRPKGSGSGSSRNGSPSGSGAPRGGRPTGSGGRRRSR
jgi:superfamily II DNA/RNA helicase